MRRTVIRSILALTALLVTSAIAYGAARAASAPSGIFALNSAASQERAGVRLEVVRVVIGRKAMLRREGRDVSNMSEFRNVALVGELILKVTNNSGRPVMVDLNSGTVLINDEPIRYQAGDDMAGYLLPGGTQISSHLFGIRAAQLGEIDRMTLRIPAPVDEAGASLGASFELGADLSRREYPPRKVK